MISIIGAGPVGSYMAYLLAKNDLDVEVFEEHKKIGEPIQCTGITTSQLKKIIKLDKSCILNEISKARIYGPNRKYIELNLKDQNIILDRKKFDNQIADMAKKAGAKFHLNHRFIENKNNTAMIKDKIKNKIKKVSFDRLIGADGPLSPVAKSNSLFKKRKFWTGIQIRAKLKNDNAIEFYPYFGTYAWVVPESKNIVRIGLVAKRYTSVLFKNFAFKLKGIKEKDIIEYQAGLIPEYDPRAKANKDTIYIVGDAAAHVKATTGGGIVQGLKAAKALSNSIIYSKSYEKRWRKSIGKELSMHLKARKILDKFKDKDWNKLIEIMASKEAKKIIETNDRDNINRIIFKLLIKKPSLLRFIKYIL